MRLTPRSTARRSARRESSSRGPPHIPPPMAQAPKPISEKDIPVLPSGRYRMGRDVSMSTAQSHLGQVVDASVGDRLAGGRIAVRARRARAGPAEEVRERVVQAGPAGLLARARIRVADERSV